MLFANLALFIQIRKKNKLFGKRTYQFKKEQCNMVIVLLFFELSYGIRYVNDQFFSQQILEKRGLYAYFVSYQVIVALDGVSFLVLLLFHYRNFRPMLQ